MADVGDPCLPERRLGARPLNTTVVYPDGQQVNLLVFRRRCPCARDLHCDPDAGACAARAARPQDNTL
ncbi:hypothetical protein ONE63_003265 [Megalurothrips usitatus]|uniref:Uncharacterized protein n=1 Tax=Megalurothrips usitatus TaxID=439358 RepID=A0AAV7XB01_9NEOP|nr:hypothetical protein ONE63_003265 [Megalurothrips usitatus]